MLHSQILGPCNFTRIIEQFTRHWETTMRQNVVLTIFHTQNMYEHVWNAVGTTLQCIIGHQLRGGGHEMEKTCETNVSHSFPCFSNLLPGIGEQ